jgi:predicted transcriptional regulator
MRQKPSVGRAELEILRYITDHHPVTVREVADHVANTKGHARTTVLTVMERLRQKGHLTRKKIEGVYHYLPSVPKTELLQNLVDQFVETALGGSVSPFMAYLSQTAKLTDDELRELKRLVRELETQKREGKT